MFTCSAAFLGRAAASATTYIEEKAEERLFKRFQGQRLSQLLRVGQHLARIARADVKDPLGGRLFELR